MRVLASLLLASLLVAGCSSSPASKHPSTDAPSPMGSVSPAALASYLHDLSPKDATVTFAKSTMEHDRVAAEDGTELDTWTAIPPGKGPFPVILTLTPYYSGGAPATLGRLGDEFLPRGYAVSISTVRGTGTSGGCFNQGSELEARDNAKVVDFLGTRPWSNGNVGIIGVSYEGTTPQETWVESPAHLKTIVPIAAISDFYKYNFVNGVPIFIQGYGFNTYYWAEEDLLWDSSAPGDPTAAQDIATSIAGAPCPEQANVQEGGVSATLTGNKDAYWQSRDFVARLAQKVKEGKTPTASVYYVHGLQDWNVKDHMEEGWLDGIKATGVPMKELFGQWPHAWPQSTSTTAACKPTGQVPVAACRNDWWNTTLVAWFDQFLKGRDTGILDAPRAQVQNDDGTWHQEADWPPTHNPHLVLGLEPSGKLGATAGTGSVSYQDGGGDNAASSFTGVAGNPVSIPLDARFVSEPMANDTRLAGTPVFTANVTASGPKASLVLTLAEQRPDGTLRAINFAAQSLNHVASLSNGNPDVAGMTQQVSVRFFLQDDVVHAGSRIVLIAAGNTEAGDQPGPALQPVNSGGTITIGLAGAALDLSLCDTFYAESPQPFDP